MGLLARSKPYLGNSSLHTVKNESLLRGVLAAQVTCTKLKVPCPQVTHSPLFWFYKRGSHQQHCLATQLHSKTVQGTVPCSTTALLFNWDSTTFSGSQGWEWILNCCTLQKITMDFCMFISTVLLCCSAFPHPSTWFYIRKIVSVYLWTCKEVKLEFSITFSL